MTASARLLQEALVILVFKHTSQFGSTGKCENTLCLPEPGSTCARGSIGGSWEELEVSALLCIGSPRSSSEVLSSTQFSLNSCSQSGNSCEKSLCTSFDSSFLFWFSVSVDSCSGSPRRSSFVPPLLSDTGVSTSLLSDSESLCSRCWLLWWRLWRGRWTRSGGRTRWYSRNHKWYIVWHIAINSLEFFDEMWFLTAFPVMYVPMFFAEFRQWKHCGSFLKKHNSDE